MLPKPLPHGDEPEPPRRRSLDELIPVGHRTRWPVGVPPAPKEPLHAWLARASHRYGLTPRQFLIALGVPNEQTAARLLAQVPRHVAEIAAALGPVVGGYRFPENADTSTPRIYNAPLHFCPVCLTESGTWNTDWQTEWALTCPTHNILLNTQCPSCDANQWAPSSWLSRSAPPQYCTERNAQTEATARRTVRGWCNQDLRDAPTTSAPPGLVEAQQNLHQALRQQTSTPDATLPLGAWGTITHEQHAHAITTLISLAADEPSSITEKASTLLEAWTAYNELRSPTGTGPHLHQLLGDPSQSGLLGPPITAINKDLGPLLTAAGLKQDAPLSANKQLAFRTGRAWPTHPPDWTRRPSNEAVLPEHLSTPLSPPAEWIPQVLWPGFAIQPPTTEPTTRATQSMLLLHLGRASRWSHLALELGLPASMQHMARAHLQNLAQTHWPEVLTDLERQFERLLAKPPPINYRVRRVIAHDPADLKRALDLTTGTETAPDVVRHFWEAFTGGDISLATARIAMDPNSGEYAAFTKTRTKVRTNHKQVFATALEHLQQEFGMPAGEPLVWSPPP